MSDATIRGGRHRARDTGPEESRSGYRSGATRKPARGDRTVRIVAAALAGLIGAWAVANFTFADFAVATLSPEANASLREVGRIDKLLSALVLFLLAADAGRQRLRWVAAGFLVLGVGRDALNYLARLLGADPNINNTQVYVTWVEWTFVGALFLVGLLPKTPPRLSWRWALAILAGFFALGAAVLATTDVLPPLVEGVPRWMVGDVVGLAPLPGLTAAYYALFAIPVLLVAAAAVGTALRDRAATVGGWLVVAMVLMTGAELHGVFWPFPHPEILSSTRLLYHAVSATVVVGGILELRRIAAERSTLLAAEQERTNRLRELATLKADFTAMVAHELGNPLAAIRGYTDMLSSGQLAPDRQARTLEAIQAETEALRCLISDVQAAAFVEREDFEVNPRPVPLEVLLADAEAYAHTLPGEHPLIFRTATHERVLADADRIGQVLRNLLSNAAKYSPEGTPIDIRTAASGVGRVRVEVEDRGPGVHPDDTNRIFEKFGRGREMNGQKVAGAGLGLYLSRRIVRAHGGELAVETRSGGGSVFAFDLELLR